MFGYRKTETVRGKSATPEPTKLKSLGREYCMRKRTQSARNFYARISQLESKSILRNRLVRKSPEKQKISEESNLYIQTEAYADRWEHKKLLDEEARKLEKENFRKMEEAKRMKELADLKKEEEKKKRRKKKRLMMVKIGTFSVDSKQDKTMRSSGECHSAKSKVAEIADEEVENKRMHSAASYKIHCDNSFKFDVGKSGYDEAAKVEIGEPYKSVFGQRVTQGTSCIENETEKDDETSSKGKSESGEISKRNVKPDNTQKQIWTNKSPVESSIANIPKVVLLSAGGTPEIVLEGVVNNAGGNEETDTITSELPEKSVPLRKRGLSVFQPPTIKEEPGEVEEAEDAIDDEPATRPEMFRERKMSMFSGTTEVSEDLDNADDTTVLKGRRLSKVMQSILAFRLNVLKKKKLVIYEHEEEYSEEEDCDLVTLVLMLCSVFLSFYSCC
jgi:hypothetical protein